MKKTGWIILGIIVVLVLWVFSGYNGMVGEQEKATTELSNMQAQYQRRADMMPQLAKIVKAYDNRCIMATRRCCMHVPMHCIGKMHRSLCVNRTRIHTSRLCMRNIWVNR